VWQAVCPLLPPPERLAEAYRRRLRPESRATRTPLATVAGQISTLRQGIARWSDRDAEGLIDQGELEPRGTRLRQRRARVEEQRQALADEAAVQGAWPLMMGRLEDCATTLHDGLEAADGASKRDRIRALGKRVAVARLEVNVVFRIDPYPGDNDPKKKSLPLCRGREWSRDSAHLHDSHRACFTILLPQTKRDSFPALRFPALQTSMVTLRGRLHMAGSAQAFGVVAGLLSTVATGRPVMKIEVHRCAAALTPCSTFCLHLCLACAPALLMLGLAQPGMLRAWGVAWRNLGLPVLAQRGIVRCAGPVFRPRLSAHPVEEEHGVAMLEAHVIPGALFAVFVHRHDAVGRTPMSLLQPTEHALIDPAIEGCDDGRGIAVAVIGAPAPQDRVECTQLEPRSLPTPSSRRHCPDGGLQALWGFVTRCDQPCRSVLAIDRASSRKTEDMEAVVHLRDVRLFHGAFALQCFCEESRKRLPPTIGLLVAAMGQHEPSIRLSDERTVALIGLPATLLPRAVEAAVVGPPMQVQLVPIDICEHGRAYSPYKVANFFFRGPHRQGTDRPETRY
jgi:hypothetical protein